MMPRADTLRETSRLAADWLRSRGARNLAAVLAIAIAGQLAFLLYETVALGLPPFREEPARFDGFHLVRSAFALAVSGLLVAALTGARAADCALGNRDLTLPAQWAALLALAAAFAATLLAIVDPAAFHGFAQEDRPLEWASALLLLAGAGLFMAGFVRHLAAPATRRGPAPFLILSGGLALLLFLIGMEEISWGQRLFGFDTPEALAEVNWQSEFNFHNVQTDLSETVYYLGAGIFLTLLPLVRDVVPPPVASHWLFAYAPGRGVAAVSAPVAIFNYGHWNLIPIQLTAMLTVFVLLAYARAALARGSAAERALFLLAACAVALGQALFLAIGPTMADIPDATEYKEFFIALGLAWYALGVFQSRSVRR